MPPRLALDLGCLLEARPRAPLEIKTILGRVKVTLTLAFSGIVPRILFNMVAKRTLHRDKILAREIENLAPRGKRRELALRLA